MIKWKDDYNTGITKIDNQHKKLFEIANRAYDLLKDEFTLDKYDDIVAILEELKDYAVYHFNSEEEYMQSVNCKTYPAQKKEHDKFIEKIQSVDLFSVDENQEEFLLEVLGFIVNWIEKHILGIDKQITKNS